MNAKIILARLLPIITVAWGCAPAAIAGDVAQSLPQVRAVRYVFDCQTPHALPSQRQVGEWTGQRNFSQVYASRQQLMAQVGRLCRKDGIGQVHVVSTAALGTRDVYAGAASPAVREWPEATGPVGADAPYMAVETSNPKHSPPTSITEKRK